MSRRALALPVIVAVIGAACGSDEGTSRATTTTTTVAAPTTTAPATSASSDPPTTRGDATTTTEPVAVPQDREIRTPDGRTRTYRVVVPARLLDPPPLVVALHGGLGSGRQFEEQTGLDEIAAREGFIAVYPDGVGARGTDRLRTWNGGYCCGGAVTQQVDDVSFLREMVERVTEEFGVDPGRRYVIGHSNGGIMAYRLLCEASDVVTAVFVQAASLGIEECRPSRPASLFAIHGTADRNHPIDGGVGEQGVAGVEFRSAADSVSAVAGAQGCTPRTTTTTDGANPDLTTTRYEGCPVGIVVELTQVRGASHAWMGHPSRIPGIVGEPYERLDATEEAWRRLSTQRRAP